MQNTRIVLTNSKRTLNKQAWSSRTITPKPSTKSLVEGKQPLRLQECLDSHTVAQLAEKVLDQIMLVYRSENHLTQFINDQY